MRLEYRVRGEGEPLIMIHGLFGSADNLGGIARILADEYQTISVDLRNHGRSPHSAEMTYQAMAADIIELMDEVGLEQAHVFGHSMGGKAAMQMALQFPGRINKLVVADIAPVRYGANHARILEGMQKLAEEAPQARAEAQKLLADYEDEAAVLSFLLTNWRRSDDGRWGWRLNLKAIVANYDEIAAGNSGDPFIGDVLFLRGGNSDYVLAEHRDQILNLFPNAGVRTIEGTGHWLHAEKPDMVARAVSRFLGK